MEKILNDGRPLSKWLILIIDQVIVSWSFAVSFFLIKHFEFENILRGYFFIYLGLYCSISVGVFYLKRIHTGIIRYSNTEDIFRIFSAVIITSVLYWGVVNLMVFPIYDVDRNEIRAGFLINFFISSTLLIMLRIGAKSFFFYIRGSVNAKKDVVLIYGSDHSAILIKSALEGRRDKRYDIIGFLDDNISTVNKLIEQKEVYHSKDIELLIRKHKVDKLVVMSDDLNSDAKKATIEKCMELGIKVITVPPADQWIYGQLSVNQIKDLKIEDLLQREPIVIQKDNILAELHGKRVLITGAAGSIGSEVVRQVLTYQPEFVILCDQAESPLHELQLEVEEKFPGARTCMYMADIQNLNRMDAMFDKYKPEIVFHAAAYKHVPMMENNPCEAIFTNVMGTKNLADLSIRHHVKKFVMISTDKAVNPTNVMGASKRIAEMYIQSLNNVPENLKINGTVTAKTKFVTTRFGNVLGSNGSVIPRFSQQIERGGPITVTHPEITRYFMTIPEAVQLVTEAAAMGKGGEIFIFDMGQPVKIVDLARKMIKLSGLIPDQDIKIVYSGLRPGEKLYEELLNKEEHDIPTHHEKIKISQVITYPYDMVLANITELIEIAGNGTEYDIVRKMKQIVPEYRSNNSIYEELDLVES